MLWAKALAGLYAVQFRKESEEPMHSSVRSLSKTLMASLPLSQPVQLGDSLLDHLAETLYILGSISGSPERIAHLVR